MSVGKRPYSRQVETLITPRSVKASIDWETDGVLRGQNLGPISMFDCPHLQCAFAILGTPQHQSILNITVISIFIDFVIIQNAVTRFRQSSIMPPPPFFVPHFIAFNCAVSWCNME